MHLSGEVKAFKLRGNWPLVRGTLIAPLAKWDRFEYRGQTFEYRSAAQLVVWCPFCHAEHLHAWHWAMTGIWASHRWEHCYSPPWSMPSTFGDRGYYVSVWRKQDRQYPLHAVEPGLPPVRDPRTKRTVPPDHFETGKLVLGEFIARNLVDQKTEESRVVA